MSFLEKLLYFTLSAGTFAVALIIHYYLAKPAPADRTKLRSSSPSELTTSSTTRRKMSYKPRGVLARTVYEKVHNDQYLDGFDMKLVCILLFRAPKIIYLII